MLCRNCIANHKGCLIDKKAITYCQRGMLEITKALKVVQISNDLDKIATRYQKSKSEQDKNMWYKAIREGVNK